MNFRVMVLGIALLAAPLGAQEPLTPQSAHLALRSQPQGEAATQLTNRLRGWFGAENLKKGPNPKVQELDAVWAIEAPGAQKISVVSTTSDWRLPLAKLGNSDVWAASAMLPSISW